MLTIIGIIVTLMLLLLAAMQLQNGLVATIGIILSVVAAFGTFRIVQSSMIEYEYTFTNGELDIDKIIAKKTLRNAYRKREKVHSLRKI